MANLPCATCQTTFKKMCEIISANNSLDALALQIRHTNFCTACADLAHQAWQCFDPGASRAFREQIQKCLSEEEITHPERAEPHVYKAHRLLCTDCNNRAKTRERLKFLHRQGMLEAEADKHLPRGEARRFLLGETDWMQ